MTFPVIVWLVFAVLIAIATLWQLFTWSPQSAFPRRSLPWVLVVGMALGAALLTTGYEVGAERGPVGCQEVGTLATTFQAFNLELDSATTVAAALATQLNRARFTNR